MTCYNYCFTFYINPNKFVKIISKNILNIKNKIISDNFHKLLLGNFLVRTVNIFHGR